MNNKIMLFENEEFGKVRGMEINGEPWVVGKDVAEILGYKNTKDALINHVDTDDKQIIQRSQITTFENHIPKDVFPVDFVDANVPNRGLMFINESGFYSLVMSSKLPNAKKFKRWVTHEVLPQIRKTGGYILGEEHMSEDELILKAMTVLNNKVNRLQEKADRLEIENKQQYQLISELKPKADYLDDILQNKSTMNITVIAKDYGMGAAKFNLLLHDLQVQYKQGKQWFLYAKYQGKGYTHSSTSKIEVKGKEIITINTKWTQKGRLFLYYLLKENGIIPLIEKKDEEGEQLNLF